MPAWLPSGGLIREHYEYGTWCTDGPPIYHVASMLSSVASICADTARLVVDNHPFPLHVWTMLVGRSSQDRKTTCARIATSRIESVMPQRIQRIYGSPEGLLQSLATNPCVCLYVPEGGAFFAQREASYWKHARDIFMDLYDYTKLFERRLVKDVLRIPNPRISILAACAYPLLERYTRDTDWLGGFLARFIMIAGKPKAHMRRPRSDERVEKRIELLIDNVFKTQWGTLGCTTAARQILDDFDAEIFSEIDAYPAGLAPSLSRLSESSNRLAGLYEIAAQATNPPKKQAITLVSAESASCAVALCRASRDDALSHLGELTTPLGAQRDIAKVESLIRRGGLSGISRTALVRATHMHSKDLNKILDTLSEAELIEYVVSASARRPTTRYVHSEARNDGKRMEKALVAAKTLQKCWIDLSGAIAPILDALPAASRPGPGVAYGTDDEDELFEWPYGVPPIGDRH